MATGAVQAGHCFRRSGSTGAVSEQSWADRVSREAVRRFNAQGHSAIRVLADGVTYRAWDFFVAVHFDGSIHASANGASVGYTNHARSRQLAQRWKSAYRNRGWSRAWRADNYTPALRGYYGTVRARRAGTKAAFILEGGFGTNAADRRWMENNVNAAAQSIVDAVNAEFGARGPVPAPTRPTPAPPPKNRAALEEYAMKEGQRDSRDFDKMPVIEDYQRNLNRFFVDTADMPIRDEFKGKRGVEVMDYLDGGEYTTRGVTQNHLKVDGIFGTATRRATWAAIHRAGWILGHSIRPDPGTRQDVVTPGIQNYIADAHRVYREKFH